MKLIRYLLNEAGDWEPGDGMESNLLSDKLYKKWAAEQTKGEPRKKLKDMSPEFQKAWKKEQAKNDSEKSQSENEGSQTERVVSGLESSIESGGQLTGSKEKMDKFLSDMKSGAVNPVSHQVSVLIHGRQSAEMKAFKDAREKDPVSVAGQFGVKGGPGWDGMLNVINSISKSKGLGAIVAGGVLVSNGGNIDPEAGKPMVGIHVMCTNMWTRGHENSQVSKKLVAWWIKQIIHGSFQGGIIGAPNSRDKRFKNTKKANFKRWDQKWKVYESSGGGILIFYGRQKDWNGGFSDDEY